MASRRALAWVTLVAAGGACDAASPDPGLGAWLRVDGAAYAPAPLPEPSGGPAVTSTRLALSRVEPAAREVPFAASLAPDATAALLGLDGDDGHWILVAGPPDVAAPAEPTIAAALSFAAEVPVGARDLLVQAVDAAGRVGPARRETLLVEPPPPPAGVVVITLRWDTNADLDLRVIDPAGVEIWARNINSYQAPPPGTPVDPEAWRQGGILDFDSNANCAGDGRRRENVVWATTAPAGTYRVRVSAAALCGAPAARFLVEARVEAVVVGSATGLLGPEATRGKQGPGEGLEVLAFTRP